MGSLMVGPIISGSMALHVGWRNFWWLNVAMAIFIELYIIFLFPETKWQRSRFDEVVHKQQLEGGTHIADPEEKIEANREAPLAREETAQRDPHLGKGKPTKQQFLPFQPNAHPFKAIFYDLWIPWKLFAFPIVEFASFVVSWSCSSFLTLNLTQSQAFAAPPYNFSSQTIGFTNFAILVSEGILS
jgi:MFS family permease